MSSSSFNPTPFSSSAASTQQRNIWLLAYGADGPSLSPSSFAEYTGSGRGSKQHELAVDECHTVVLGPVQYTLIHTVNRKRAAAVDRFMEHYCAKTPGGVGSVQKSLCFSGIHGSSGLVEHPAFRAMVEHHLSRPLPRGGEAASAAADGEDAAPSPAAGGFSTWIERPDLRGGGMLATFCRERVKKDEEEARRNRAKEEREGVQPPRGDADGKRRAKKRNGDGGGRAEGEGVGGDGPAAGGGAVQSAMAVPAVGASSSSSAPAAAAATAGRPDSSDERRLGPDRVRGAPDDGGAAAGGADAAARPSRSGGEEEAMIIMAGHEEEGAQEAAVPQARPRDADDDGASSPREGAREERSEEEEQDLRAVVDHLRSDNAHLQLTVSVLLNRLANLTGSDVVPLGTNETLPFDDDEENRRRMRQDRRPAAYWKDMAYKNAMDWRERTTRVRELERVVEELTQAMIMGNAASGGGGIDLSAALREVQERERALQYKVAALDSCNRRLVREGVARVSSLRAQVEGLREALAQAKGEARDLREALRRAKGEARDLWARVAGHQAEEEEEGEEGASGNHHRVRRAEEGGGARGNAHDDDDEGCAEGTDPLGDGRDDDEEDGRLREALRERDALAASLSAVENDMENVMRAKDGMITRLRERLREEIGCLEEERLVQEVQEQLASLSTGDPEEQEEDEDEAAGEEGGAGANDGLARRVVGIV